MLMIVLLIVMYVVWIAAFAGMVWYLHTHPLGER
jgi:hypothetical protein